MAKHFRYKRAKKRVRRDIDKCIHFSVSKGIQTEVDVKSEHVGTAVDHLYDECVKKGYTPRKQTVGREIVVTAICGTGWDVVWSVVVSPVV